MPAAEIHVGDTPIIRMTLYDGTTLVDLTSYTTLEMDLKKPDGTTATVTMTAPTPTNGQMEFEAAVGTFDQSGDWQAQGRIDDSAEYYHTDIINFRVHANLI